MDQFRLFIDGRSVDARSGRFFESINYVELTGALRDPFKLG